MPRICKPGVCTYLWYLVPISSQHKFHLTCEQKPRARETFTTTGLTGHNVEHGRRRQPAVPERLRHVQDPAPEYEVHDEEHRHEPVVVLASCTPPKYSGGTGGVDDLILVPPQANSELLVIAPRFWK